MRGVHREEAGEPQPARPDRRGAMMMTEMQVVVTSAIVMVVGLVAFTIGLWVGQGRREEAEEAELDRAMAGHAPWPGRHRQDTEMPEPAEGAYGPFPVPEEDIILLTTPVTPVKLEQAPEAPDSSVTAWTRAMAADTDQFIKGMVEDSDVVQHLIRARSGGGWRVAGSWGRGRGCGFGAVSLARGRAPFR